MKNFKLTRISTDLSWPEVLKDGKIVVDVQKKHQETFDRDYDYLGNLDINFPGMAALSKNKITFRCRSGRDNPILGYRLPTDHPKLLQVKEYLGLVECYGNLQNLLPGTFVSPHRDGPVPLHEINETTRSRLMTSLYLRYQEKYPDFDQISIEKFHNVAIVFLEPWYQGQAFLIGRDSITNWKKGDVFSFPWYMEHSTVNLSEHNRHILFVVGSVI